jgi:hypothetical protein
MTKPHSDQWIATAAERLTGLQQAVSVEYQGVVDVVRRRQIRCVGHHLKWIDAGRGCGGNMLAGPDSPRADANQDKSSDKHADLEHLNSPFDTALPQGLCHGANETISQSEIDIDNNSAFFIDSYSVVDAQLLRN